MIQAPQGLEKLLSDYHHARILRLTFPNKDVLPSAPLVNQLDASEWRSRDFTLTLEIMADQARLESRRTAVPPVRHDAG
jgi:type VI secretion system secreted protein VgrG